MFFFIQNKIKMLIWKRMKNAIGKVAIKHATKVKRSQKQNYIRNKIRKRKHKDYKKKEHKHKVQHMTHNKEKKCFID